MLEMSEGKNRVEPYRKESISGRPTAAYRYVGDWSSMLNKSSTK